MSSIGTSPGLDPARLTPEQLFGHVNSIITKGYEELTMYNFVMEDLLTKGTQYYILDLNRARAWNNRVLGMLQEIRQVSATVSKIAMGRERLLEVAIGDWLTTQKRESTLPKGLDANERMCLARRACSDQEEDKERWQALVLEVESYVKCLQDKQKDLANVKEDLRTQLWAVRVHGVLGEIAKDGQSGTFNFDPPKQTSPTFTPMQNHRASAYHSIKPDAEQPIGHGAPLQEDPDISRLLDGD